MNNATLSLLRKYLADLKRIHSPGDAREESFYQALADLVCAVAKQLNRNNIQATIQPRPTNAGNPDIRIWDGSAIVVGYVEAKSPTERLDNIEDSEQLRRYRTTFPNVILTNFLEFRLYRNGQRIATARLGQPHVLTSLRHTPPLEQPQALWSLLEQFLAFSLPRAFTAESLATELAKRTRFLRDIVRQELAQEQQGGSGHLLGFYEAFQKFLIGSLSPDEFADLYAQTITYGLFAARTRATSGFSRVTAFKDIPSTIGILCDLFQFISLGKPSEEMVWIVDEIVQVLAAADVSGMMSQFYRQGRGEDPIVHFYETFLAHYDPEERERRGVYYTPDPVVSYIVRSLHILLKNRFGKTDGLASEGVTLLDPAAGTMTFVARAAEQAVQEFVGKYGEGGRETFIRNHILRNFYAFELMMAPYAVGHLKMAFFLEELGHRLQENERVPFYLTNTLDMSELEASKLPGLSSLAEESHLAGRVKRQQPILVILGNPPYSGHSANRGEWILRQIETYRQVDGKPLGEKNPKWLQDDYVKFLRFAQWKIEQAGCGVVGMITNHGYLDNPTFRGMRQSLMQTFDEIYLLDLHGNTLKRERCPDGSPDENVFDIRQGVAIALLIKHGKEADRRVCHADLWGARESKYEWLNKNDVQTTPWQEIHPQSPFYLFVPRDEAELERYQTFPSVTDLFETYSVGIVTARDNLTIRWTPEEVWTTVLSLSRLDPELARQAYTLGDKVSSERIRAAQNDVKNPERDKVVPILYRPFDVRYTYYTGKANGFHERPRPEVMRHMLAGENVALITPRRMEYVGGWQHAFVSQTISEHVAVSLKTIDYHFPLYLYPDSEEQGRGARQQEMLVEDKAQGRRPNLKAGVLESLAQAYGKPLTPEQVFYYLYAVLYAPAYREKYADFLRLDFPRIPFTADVALFTELAALGERLVNLHLLRSSELDPPLARFEGQGENKVVKVRYDVATERVYINPDQYFAPVLQKVWQYTVGGYRVCEKWLNDRRGRQLTLDEIRAYVKIITALSKTLTVQKEIDNVYARLANFQLLERIRTSER